MRSFITKTFFLITTLSLTSSCALFGNMNKSTANKVPNHINDSIKADIKKFFDGDIKAFSVVFDENDKIINTKTIEINGSWEQNKGIIRQKFVDSKGKKDSRTWLITLEKGGNFSAIGHDSVAPANGVQVGNAMQMSYSLLIPYFGIKSNVDYTDIMYVVDPNSMIKISEFSRKDKKLGKEIISLTKMKKAKKYIAKKAETNIDNKTSE